MLFLILSCLINLMTKTLVDIFLYLLVYILVNLRAMFDKVQRFKALYFDRQVFIYLGRYSGLCPHL